ncbi:MAG: type II toxin-antitoxin system VapC family toxin [Tagaea sp.]
MNGWLLDTNVLSELSKLRPDPRVVAWLTSRHEADIYVSAFTFAEIAKGIAKRAVTDPIAARRIERSAQSTRARFAGRVLPIDDDVLRHWAEIMGVAEAHGRPVDGLDQFFAATALAHGLVLATRNTRDFPPDIVGVTVVDPWND